MDNSEVERKLEALDWLQSHAANGYVFYKGHQGVFVENEGIHADNWVNLVEILRARE